MRNLGVLNLSAHLSHICEDIGNKEGYEKEKYMADFWSQRSY